VARDKMLAKVHFWLTAVSGVGLMIGLYYEFAGSESMEPVLAIASMGFYAGFLLFAFIALPVVWRK
jgi:hypothetical protein